MLVSAYAARPVNARNPSRQSRKSRYDTPRARPCASRVPRCMTRPGSSTGRSRRFQPLMTVNTVVLTPTPSARATTTAAVNQRSLMSNLRRETQIVQEGIEGRQPAGVSMSLVEGCGATHANQCRAPRLFGCQASTKVVLGEHRDVRLQFLLEVTIEVAGSERTRECAHTVPSGRRASLTPACRAVAVSR